MVGSLIAAWDGWRGSFYRLAVLPERRREGLLTMLLREVTYRVEGMKPVYLSICAIFKDEAPYLPEWIEFHRSVGVERFFLYDNSAATRAGRRLDRGLAPGSCRYQTARSHWRRAVRAGPIRMR